MEHGQRLRENAKISSLLREVGERLMIAEREVEAVPIKKCEGFEKKDGGSKEGTEGKVDEGTGRSDMYCTVWVWLFSFDGEFAAGNVTVLSKAWTRRYRR